MSDTLSNTTLPANTWVNLYTATSITVGTQINTQNLGGQDVYLYSGATAPTETALNEIDGYRVLERRQQLNNESGDAGAWALSVNIDGLINVSEA